MLLLSGNCTLKMTAINTQGFILSYKKPRGWQTQVVWQWAVRDPGYFKLFFLASSRVTCPHGSLWLLELQPSGLPPANRKEEEAGKNQKSEKP